VWRSDAWGVSENIGVIRNPFDDPALAAGYEAWYETEGRAADRREHDLLGWLLSGFPSVRPALEIGAGTGHFTRWMHATGWKVIGLDGSEPMLAEAIRRSGPRYVRADAGALPFAAGAFDVALLITTLEFLPDPARALRGGQGPQPLLELTQGPEAPGIADRAGIHHHAPLLPRSCGNR